MAIEELRSVLGWCALLGYALLLFWFGCFALGREWLRGLHGRWFSIPDESFDAIHYTLMGVFKLLIFTFHLLPWAALWAVA